MKRLVAVLAVAALVLPGCSRPAPGRRAAAPEKGGGTALAAIVEFDTTGGPQGERTLRKIGRLGVTTLPVLPYCDSDVELSADGHTLLYTPTPAHLTPRSFTSIPARYSEATEVCALDVSSEATRAVFHGSSVTYGYDSRGRLVVLAGHGPEDSRTMMTHGPFLSDLSLVTIKGSTTVTRSVDTSAFARLSDLRFLGADDASVYLLGVVTGIMNGSEQDLWKLDRASGHATCIAKWEVDGFAAGGERWQWVSDWLRLPASEVIAEGLPAISIIESGFPDQGGVDAKTGKPVTGHVSFGLPTAVVFDRLPGMQQVRSIPITQRGHTSPFVQAVSPDLTRCLTQPEHVSGGGTPLPFFEQSASGVTTITVAQNLRARPSPIGYLGDDILYSFYQAPSVRIAIWHRGGGACQVLCALPPGEWANKPKFLGVEYDR